ncbi:PucR family transcriptional regulator [Nocardia sp. NBC_00511]|uniref:PucR family transcriptional regulator n=1 Tax=Nocardia sp. NBC_00511 TaxID=2903591 RepID=UPI0030E1FD38
MNDQPLWADGFVACACRILLDRIDDLTARVSAEIQRTEPVYGELHLVDPDDLRKTNRDNLSAVLGYLAGDPGAGFDTPQATGRSRAEDGVPLPAVLRAYRIGSSVVWDELVALADDDLAAKHALLTMASEVWKLVDDYSQALTRGYQETVTAHARRDERAQYAALDALLTGQTDGAGLWDCARTLQLPVQGTYVAVAATTGSPTGEAIPGIADALSILGIRSAWQIRLDHHVGLVALTERFTVERLETMIAERTAGRVGIATPFHSLADTPVALRQAESTCAAADPAINEVLCYHSALIPVLLATAPDIAAALAENVLGPVLALPEHDRTSLIETARAWFDHGGEVTTVAEHLYCHRNTVRFRLNRIADLTGRHLSTPAHAVELYLALRACRMPGPAQA